MEVKVMQMRDYRKGGLNARAFEGEARNGNLSAGGSSEQTQRGAKRMSQKVWAR